MNISLTTSRRARQALVCALSTVAAVGLAACGAHYHNASGTYAVGVGTTYGPYWYPSTYGSYYYVYPYPWWGDPPPPPENDPMREGSIPQRAIAEEIRAAFNGRGYRHEANGGDFDVAVYASSQNELDITGYTKNYDWKNIPKLKGKTKYPKGTVIVDVLAPKTHELLWRGHTEAPISSDPDKYAADLREAVNRVVAKYPKSQK
jgi:Domain of unknown function (DUF4136)